MARRKRPVALFEVIHKDKRFALKTPPPLERNIPAPKNSPNNADRLGDCGVGPPLPGVAPNAPGSQQSAPIAVNRAGPARLKSRSGGPPFAERAWTWWRSLTAAAAPRFDRLKQRLAPHASIFAGVVAASIVIGGVMICRRLAPSSLFAPSGSASLQQIRQLPSHPDVLEVAAQTHPLAPQPVGDGGANANPPDALAQSAASVLPPAPRQVNLNYVLVQSYGDENTAREACEFLNKNGIPCTIERGVKNWRRDFYLVIGLQGFARVSGPDYVAYRDRIESLSAQFASPHSYKGFAPQAIKWDRTN
jgi:hypothetical protein